MPRGTPDGLRPLLEHLARLSPARHRDLVGGMVAEIDSIADPGARRRFVLGAAAVVAALTLVSNTQVVPRANGRLVAVLTGGPRAPSDREMTVGQLREAARTARAGSGPAAASCSWDGIWPVVPALVKVTLRNTKVKLCLERG